MRKGQSAGIYMPGSVKKAVIPVDKADVNFAQQQLNQGAAPLPEMTADMRKFINEVGPQKKEVKAPRISEKTSNDVYASMPIAIERVDLENVAKILEQLPKDIGRKRPDFSIRDYIRKAIKNQLEKDMKVLKKGGKIIHSRRSLAKS